VNLPPEIGLASKVGCDPTKHFAGCLFDHITMTNHNPRKCRILGPFAEGVAQRPFILHKHALA
jgi:hypothetical protein